MRKVVLFGSSMLAAAAMSSTALAQAPQTGPGSTIQTADAAETSAGGAMASEVVVTGSLVVRNGNQAPTPVTVVETAALQKLSPSNIPDALNQLPQFSGSLSPTQSSLSGTAVKPSTGNYLNLRNLGVIRSLILLDGQRVPPTSFEGTVDTNIIPQALVQRVDVVTAGASATYGSDAVSGVVNFILDTKYTGLKGSVQYGVSDRNDDQSYRVTLAGGAPVLAGRGHVLFSAEHYQSVGIDDKGARPLFAALPIAYGNGKSVPYQTQYNGRTSNTSFGGTITSGPLKGMMFNPDGSLSPFDPGPLPAQSGMQVGGSGSYAKGGSLAGALRTDQLFGRVSYDLTDNITAFAEVSYGEARNRYAHIGTDNRFNNLTIFSDNAFLTPDQQATLRAANVTSFSFSRQGTEQGLKVVDILSDSFSGFAGIQGNFASNWTWKLHYSYGLSRIRGHHYRNPENQHYFAAIDAARDPATGNIVCRVTLTNPGLYPGCVPLNILGANRASPEALQYAFGAVSQYEATNRLHDISGVVSGPIYHLPAGDVAVALGAEYRHQALVMESNADPAVPLMLTGIRGFPTGQNRFGNTNQGAANGSLSVKEAFAEVVVPLLADMPLVKNLELNGAARVTDYTTSGRVATWKVGASYTPVPDLRLRGTLSRDIRAPTLNELFAGQQASSNAFTDIHTLTTRTLQSVTSGNPNLQPEKANTLALGFVYQPTWVRGFSIAVDFYKIKIIDAIATPTATQMNQDCEDSGGTLAVCQFITRPGPFSDRSPANTATKVTVVPQNLSRLKTSGVDIDASYRFDLESLYANAPGSIQLRALANYAPTYRTQLSLAAPVQQQAGTVTIGPKLRMLLSGDYTEGPFGLTVQGRYVGKMVRSNQPTVLYVDNEIGGVWYMNLSARYDFTVAGRGLEAFVNVNNLLDKDPPLVPRTTESGLTYPTLPQYYDIVGRYYTVGLRFHF